MQHPDAAMQPVVRVFHTPTAGGGDWPAARLMAVLAAEGIQAAGWQSTKADGLDDAVAATTGPLIVAGGDGTVAKVLARLPDRRLPVAILPTGSANNIAGALGARMPATPGDLRRWLLAGDTRPFHAGRVRLGSNPPIPYFESIGAGATITAMEMQPPRPLHGIAKVTFGRAALAQALARAPSLSCDIAVDGIHRHAQAIALELPCLPWTGPWLWLGPEIRPDDRRAVAALIGPADRDAAVAWLAAPETPDREAMAAPPLSPWIGDMIMVAGLHGPLRIDDDRLTDDAAGARLVVDRDPQPFRIVTDPSHRPVRGRLPDQPPTARGSQ